MNKPSTDKSHFDPHWRLGQCCVDFLGGSLCRRYIEVIWAQGRTGHAKGTGEGRVSVARPDHFCHPPGFYLGFTVYSQVLDALYTILRNVAVCALTSSCLMIFPILLLIFCNDNNIFGGKAGHLGGGGGSFYPSNTLDRTLPTLLSSGCYAGYFGGSNVDLVSRATS